VERYSPLLSMQREESFKLDLVSTFDTMFKSF
jgi:hypothetical protein